MAKERLVDIFGREVDEEGFPLTRLETAGLDIAEARKPMRRESDAELEQWVADFNAGKFPDPWNDSWKDVSRKLDKLDETLAAMAADRLAVA